MNTFFFVRVRLGRSQGRRSFNYGPYVEYEDAVKLLDHIPTLLENLGAESDKYTATVEERHLQDQKWLKVSTPLRMKVDAEIVMTESG
jgi:hypothetical protein